MNTESKKHQSQWFEIDTQDCKELGFSNVREFADWLEAKIDYSFN